MVGTWDTAGAAGGFAERTMVALQIRSSRQLVAAGVVMSKMIFERSTAGNPEKRGA